MTALDEAIRPYDEVVRACFEGPLEQLKWTQFAVRAAQSTQKFCWTTPSYEFSVWVDFLETLGFGYFGVDGAEIGQDGRPTDYATFASREDSSRFPLGNDFSLTAFCTAAREQAEHLACGPAAPWISRMVATVPDATQTRRYAGVTAFDLDLSWLRSHLLETLNMNDPWHGTRPTIAQLRTFRSSGLPLDRRSIVLVDALIAASGRRDRNLL